MRVVVTGASGFVGRAIARRLLDEGHRVHAFVRNSAAAADLSRRGARVFTGTVGDPNEIAAAADGCNIAVHAAACSSHRAARRALEWINIAGTENVLKGVRHAGCTRMVHISCGDITLSNQDRVHWNEDRALPREPLDEHARTKRLAEELVLAESDPNELEVTALRPGLLWGPGDTTTLPALCREGQSGGVRLVGKGENLVCTTYIDHLVDATLLAARVKGAAGRAYHVTDGTFVEAQEFYGALCKAVGLNPPRTGLAFPIAYTLAWMRRGLGLQGAWPTDVVRRGRSTMLDPQRAMNELGYEPRVSMEDGMQAVAEWVRARGGPEAIADMARTPDPASAVDEQVAAAGGD